MKIVVIVVTFNSSNYLKRAIRHLLNQTVELHKIIVVDNNSNSKHKIAIKNLISTNNVLELITLDENTGGAGGFYHGMKYANEKYNPDWYWLMDDDAFPTPTCLENLLNYRKYTNNVGCLCPTIFGVEWNAFQLYHHKKLSSFLDRDLLIYDEYDKVPEVSTIEANAFVGPLFSKSVVNQLGYPDKKLFIYGDDLEYTYRVSRNYDVLLIKNSIINHRDVAKKQTYTKPQAWWKDYYMYRNRFLFIDKYSVSMIKKYIGFILTLLRVIKQIFMILFIKEYRGLVTIRVKLLKKSIVDGLNGRSGKKIDPINFNEMIKSYYNVD